VVTCEVGDGLTFASRAPLAGLDACRHVIIIIILANT